MPTRSRSSIARRLASARDVPWMRKASVIWRPRLHHRVERGHGILEYHGYLPAPDLFQLPVRQLQQVPPPVYDLSADHPGVVGQQPHQGGDRNGFPGAGFTDQAQYVARIQGESHVLDGGEDSRMGAEGDREVANLQEGVGLSPAAVEGRGFFGGCGGSCGGHVRSSGPASSERRARGLRFQHLRRPGGEGGGPLRFVAPPGRTPRRWGRSR